MYEFHPSLSGSAPAGWFVKESMTFQSPDGQANVILSSEPLAPDIDTHRYALLQSDALRNEFNLYQELEFRADTVFGDRQGYVRSFEWTPPDSMRVSQIQLYHAIPGRGYTATASTPTWHFAEVRPVLERVLQHLRISASSADPIDTTIDARAVSWESVLTSDLFTFFNCREVARRQMPDDTTVVTLQPGGFAEHVVLDVTLNRAGDVAAFDLELDRAWLDGPGSGRTYGADLATWVLRILGAADPGVVGLADETWTRPGDRVATDRAGVLAVFHGDRQGPARLNCRSTLVATNDARQDTYGSETGRWFVLNWAESPAQDNPADSQSGDSSRRPPTADLITAAQEMVAAGNLAAAVQMLGSAAEDGADMKVIAQAASLVARAAGMDDLRAAAQALADDPSSVGALYDFGFACVEHRAGALAVPPLQRALQMCRPDDEQPILTELIPAYEDLGRHRAVVDLLVGRRHLPTWPFRYLLGVNALYSGDIRLADEAFQSLPASSEPNFKQWHERLWRLLTRAHKVEDVSPLDSRDLCGWHFVLNGSILTSPSPYGADDGMNGRYAYIQDSYSTCLLGLTRLRDVLNATGERRPVSVSPLPDRDSQILGVAAASVLGLPLREFRSDTANTIVVAYDLTRSDETLARSLADRSPGQVLFEHARRWTDPHPTAPDVTTFLHEVCTVPWGTGMRVTDDGVEETPADDRPVPVVAQQILRASLDFAARDTRLERFAAVAADRWLLGNRAALTWAGPVASSSFVFRNS